MQNVESTGEALVDVESRISKFWATVFERFKPINKNTKRMYFREPTNQGEQLYATIYKRLDQEIVLRPFRTLLDSRLRGYGPGEDFEEFQRRSDNVLFPYYAFVCQRHNGGTKYEYFAWKLIDTPGNFIEGFKSGFYPEAHNEKDISPELYDKLMKVLNLQESSNSKDEAGYAMMEKKISFTVRSEIGYVFS